MTKNKGTIERYLSNPLLLLIAGAILSGLLVPYITTQWQNHEKALDLKTDLVARLSEAVSRILIVAQFTNAELPPIVDYHQAYYDWETTSSAIGSYLRAYFPDSHIGEEWNEFANVTTSFFRLSAVNPLHEKQQLIGQIQGYFSSCSNNINWTVLVDPNNRFFHNSDYRHNWFLLRDQIMFAKNNIAQKILELPISTLKPFWQVGNAYEVEDIMIKELRC